MPISVEQLDSTGAPVVSVTVTGLAAGTQFTVERTTDGREWRRVRGGAMAMPQGGTVSLSDWAAPTGSRVWYRIVVGGEPQPVSEPVTVDTGGRAWLQDAFSPQHGVPVAVRELRAGAGVFGMESFRRAEWPQPVSETLVMGAHLPVESVGARQRVGAVPIEITTLLGRDTDALRELLFQAGPLLLRGSPCETLNNQFIVIPDLVETHRGSPHKFATFTGAARVTREPSDAIRIPFWTWQQAQDLVALHLGSGTTYDDVTAAHGGATYAQIHADPRRLVGGMNRLPKPDDDGGHALDDDDDAEVHDEG